MIKAWSLFLMLMLVPSIYAEQKLNCADAPPLSDDRIKSIIADEKDKYKDIPAPYPPSDTMIRRDGCYYVYIETPLIASALPERLVHADSSIIFKLNKHGAIVDILSRNINEGVGMKMGQEFPIYYLHGAQRKKFFQKRNSLQLSRGRARKYLECYGPSRNIGLRFKEGDASMNIGNTRCRKGLGMFRFSLSTALVN
jgi:hypothetical protein